MLRHLLSVPLAAALLAAPPASVARSPLPTRPTSSPVLCANGPDGRYGYPGRQHGGAAIGRPIPMPSVMMPPPPPPPPSPSPSPERFESTAVAADSSQIAVSGSRIMAPGYYPREDHERYAGEQVAAVQAVADTPVSTFSIDVDTGSYANVRRFLTAGNLPPAAAVRTEEMLNYFRYDYPLPRDRARPFSVTTDVARTPWNAATRLLRIGIRGYDIARNERPAANLVFLVDVSGSMDQPDKLPLVRTALSNLAERLNPRDRVSIVVYAGAAGLVLEPTHDKRAIHAALDCLQAGGSTAGGAGLALAYATARRGFIEGGINRVILCTDGDFNVGTTSDEGLKEQVKRQRDSGITLTTLGFGEGNYNEAMMEAIADVGNGNYGYVDSAMEANKLLDEELSSTLFTIAHDVKIQVEFNPALVSEYRLIGYENRALREEDFANDKVDAGDIGAGHQVTALYELVPAGAAGWLPDRRYTANRARSPAGHGPADEAGWLKLRYKLPGEGASRLIEQPIRAADFERAGAARGDFAFAAAVAAFGQRLRGDTRLGEFGWSEIGALAGDGGNYWRQEFAKLVVLASGNRREQGGR